MVPAVDGLEADEGDGVPAGTGGVILIGRRKYAVGLSWQLSPTGRINQAAREAARESRVPMDFFAVRPGNKTGRLGQFGLSVKAYGHKAGMPSAALSLASDQPGAWAGAFKMPEGIWVCVCRDDLITPDGDVLYTDEGQAKERMVAEINLGGLQQIYAPEDWHIPNGDSIPLPLLLKNRAEGQLRAVRINVVHVAGLLVVLVLAVLAWLGFNWQQEGTQQQHRMALPREEEAIQQLQKHAVIPNSKLLPTAGAPQAMRRLWEDAPQSARFFQVCRDAFTSIPSVTVGWRRQGVACTGNSVTVAWQRTTGPGEIPANLSGTLRGSDTGATSVYPLPGMERRGAEQLLDPGEIAKMSINNNWPAKLSRLPDDPLPPQPDGTPTPPPPLD